MPGDTTKAPSAELLQPCVNAQHRLHVVESIPKPLIPPAPPMAKKRHVLGKSSSRIEPLRISTMPELSQAFDLAKKERRSYGNLPNVSESSDWSTFTSNTIPETLNSSRECNVPSRMENNHHATSHDDVRNPSKATPLKSTQGNYFYGRTPHSMDKENFFTPRKTTESSSTSTPAQTRCPLSSLPVDSIPCKDSIDGVSTLPSDQSSVDIQHGQSGNVFGNNSTGSLNKKPHFPIQSNDGFRTPQCKSYSSHDYRPRLYGVSSSRDLLPLLPLHPAVVAGQQQARLQLQLNAESQAPVESSASRRLIDTPLKSAPPLATSGNQNVTHSVERAGESQLSVPPVSSADNLSSNRWHPHKSGGSCQGNIHPQNIERLQGARAGQNIVRLTELAISEVPESSASSTWLPHLKAKTTSCQDDSHQVPHIDKKLNDCANDSPPKPTRFDTEHVANALSKVPSELIPHLSAKSSEPRKDLKCTPRSTEPATGAELKVVPSSNDAIIVQSAPFQVKEQVNEEPKVGAVSHEQIVVNGHVYSKLSLLGRGGSSEVFQVLDPATSQLKAVKCVNLAETEPSTCEGYLNEIKLLADLQGGDCVIHMFDHEHRKELQMLFVVMEKGDTDLSKLIKDLSRSKKISAAMIVYYWTEMLNAVSFIHKRGTIHSDLKPANFLLVSGRLKLIDFGIASAVQEDMTSIVKDCMTGTYNYISPEALSSTSSDDPQFKISYKSDVWSLGCILYSLIYGRTPFQHVANQFQKLTAIVNPSHKIQFPAVPIEGCPPVLLQALKMCLIRNPKERASVDTLLQLPYLDYAGPERVILSQVVSLSASVGLVQDSEDNRYAAVVRAIQRLIIENERQLPFLGGR